MVMFGWFFNGCPRNNASKCQDIAIFLPEKTAQLGVSSFWFYLTPNGIIPQGEKTELNFEDFCDRKNSSGQSSVLQGRGCTAWVILNDNMDYLHCDDLSWDGKTKCK